MNDHSIDTIASLGKLEVEGSNRDRDEKERIKTKIDCLSSLIKQMQTHPGQNATFMGVPIARIQEVKKIARLCSVNKVELFPFPNGDTVIPLITVQGGDKELFFRLLGSNTIDPNQSSKFASEFDSLREKYGVILYEII